MTPGVTARGVVSHLARMLRSLARQAGGCFVALLLVVASSFAAKLRPIEASPTGQSTLPVAYDARRHVTVALDRDGLTSFVIEYDGKSWHPGPGESATRVPPIPYAIAYDSYRGICVIVKNGYGTPGETWEYDGRTFSPGPAIPTDLLGGGAIAYDSRRKMMVLAGGYPTHLSEYDGTTWRQLADPPIGPRGMAFDERRGVMVLAAPPDVFEYDGTGFSQGVSTPFQSWCYEGTATYDSNRQVFVYVNSSCWNLEVWEYDGAAWRPGAIPDPWLIIPGWEVAATYDPDQKEVLFTAAASYAYGHAELWNYRPGELNRLWPESATGPRQMGSIVAFDEGRNRMLVTASMNGSYGTQEFWELSDGEWRLPALDPPAETLFLRAVYDSRRKVVVFFGGTASSSDRIFEYDGVAWTAGVPPPPALGPRQGNALAFDPIRGRVVSFGGLITASLTNDTWEYDGTGWYAGPTAPPGLTPRTGASRTNLCSACHNLPWPTTPNGTAW